MAFTLAGAASAAFIDLSGTVTSCGVGDPVPIEPFSTGDTLIGFIEIDDSAAVMPGRLWTRTAFWTSASPLAR